MAFFDFDRGIQTLLIAGALASTTACGGSTSLDGATDPAREDRVDLVDTFPEAVDPAVDVLDGPVTCPDPDTWEVSIAEQDVTWPEMTLRVTLDLDEELIAESDPVFTVEKKSIVDVRPVSAGVYDVDYRWEGPLEHEYWDWDQFEVSWRVRCVDDFGSYERTITRSRILCVDGGWIWIAWGSDPDSCMVVDCVPDTMPTVDAGDDRPAVLARGVLQTRLRDSPLPDGSVRLSIETAGPAAPSASHTWIAQAGKLSANGRNATWTPPAEPGAYAVQVVTRSAAALTIDVYRKIVKP